MALDYIIPEFEVVRNDARCTRCRICESQCANGVGYLKFDVGLGEASVVVP